MTTYHELIESITGHQTELTLEALLWQCTPYPAGTPEQIVNSLQKCWEGGGRTVDGALKFAEKMMDLEDRL